MNRRTCPRPAPARTLLAASCLLLAILALSGCAGVFGRRAVLYQLNPVPMSETAWAGVRGVYAGPVRAATQRFGFEGVQSMDFRLELSGYASDPGILMRVHTGYITAWTMYGEWKGTYTNLPSRRYGTQGWVEASTHAPDQLLIRPIANGIIGPREYWMILTFHPHGVASIDFIGHNGYRGEGELWRVPRP